MIQVLNYNEEDETHRFVLFMNCAVKGKKLGFDQCIFKIGDKRFELDTILARGYYTESIDCYSETVEISTLSFEVIDLFDALLEAYENNTPVKLRMKGSGGHYDFDITNNIYYIAEFWAAYKRAYMNEGL